MRARGRERGQAAVELVALLPLLIAVGAACTQLLLAGLSRELAGHAAEAAAVARIEGGDPAGAAQDALPGWSRADMQVSVAGDRVRVRLAPPTIVPGLGALLATTATATAGSAK